MSCTYLSALVFSLLMSMLPAGGRAEETAREKILAVFHPYRQGPLQEDGIAPGITIDKTNAQLAAAVLPPEILNYIAAGDFAITVQPITDMPLRQTYIEATINNVGKAVLGEDFLQNYVAGRPFPLIDPQDPQAGLKVAWNLRYRDQCDNAQMWSTNELRNSSGGVERAQSFYFISMYGMHRPEPEKNVPQWGQSGFLSKQYSRTLAPSDMEGNQILTIVYDDNSRSDEQWVYDPRTRRTRKMVYNPYDAPGGGEVLVEDRAGFIGHIPHYEWKYLGEQLVLAPGPIKTTEPTLGGRGNWYPVDPWELRRAHVIEARPKGSHPLYSRRVLYIDVQASVVLYGLVYDLQGNHKRTFFLVYRHPDFNPWNNEIWCPQTAAQPSIDYQRERATIFQTHKILFNRPMPESRFSTMGLLLYGK
jgi:hypothetical protein